jgi:hypothetical protein
MGRHQREQGSTCCSTTLQNNRHLLLVLAQLGNRHGTTLLSLLTDDRHVVKAHQV